MKTIAWLLAIVCFFGCSKDEEGPTPAITSFSPESGNAGTVVTINGSNFGETVSDNTVTFNGSKATINTASATQLVVVVPPTATTGKISITAGGVSSESVDTFTVFQTPTITGFTPQSGSAGMSITINGTGFSANASEDVVKFGDAIATVSSATATSIVVTVPPDAITGTISVTAHELKGTSTALFTVIPTITEVTPISAPISSTLTIKGTGFKGTLVKIGTLGAQSVSETPTEVKVLVPYIANKTTTTFKVTVVVGTTTLEYPTSFTYTNSWVRKSDFPGTDRQEAVFFAIGSKGYYGMGSDFNTAAKLKDLWEYDPSSDTWAQKADLPGDARSGAFYFAAGGKGYVGSGYKTVAASAVYLTDLWGYDPVTNSWATRADFPAAGRSLAASVVIGDKAYVGTGGDYSTTLYKDFWQYDPGANSWTQKADFVGDGRRSAFAFSLNGKGYLGGGISTDAQKSATVAEYDAVANQWTKKHDYPDAGSFSEHAGFSIDNTGYVGRNNICQRYQVAPQNDFWADVDYPASVGSGERIIVIGNKAYLVTGLQVWEFTPPN
jgi:N-acetylneuraminic acid mutarotase